MKVCVKIYVILILIGLLTGLYVGSIDLLKSFSSVSLVFAQGLIHDHNTDTNTSLSLSKYTDEVKREIKSLSSVDIESLNEGTGDAFGGLAILAELNGYPGPRHILDLANQLRLTEKQKENITMIYNNMKTEAIGVGKNIIQIESITNEKFENKSITDNDLKELILSSAQLYGKLRYLHLSTHLNMIEILTKEQVELYKNLRGYSQAHH